MYKLFCVKNKRGLGEVANTCDPSYLGAEIRRIAVKFSLGKQLSRPHLNTEARLGSASVIPATQEA
jgi:hypothetical protein